MSRRRLSCVVGVDDAPFEPKHGGNVAVIGAVYNGVRPESVMRGKVRRDGALEQGESRHRA